VRFRLLAGDGTVLDQGEAQVEMAGGALVVTPPFGQVLRVAPADVVQVLEPQPYFVHLMLADGHVLEMTQLGVMRTQILGELNDARITDTEDVLLLDGVGKPECFPGAVDGSDAELRLYDDALVAVSQRGDAEKIPYPFVRGIDTDTSGYRLKLDIVGRDPMIVQRLARRTTEFVDVLKARVGTASGRTSHFLAALLPGLGPVALRAVAGLVRDGLAGARTDLDAVEPSVFPALLDAATLPDRVEPVRHLLELGTCWVGFKQMVSVERDAIGTTAWHDSAITPHFDHGGNASSFGGGFGGMFAAGMMSGGPTALGFDGPFSAVGPTLAFGMLGHMGGFGGGFGGSGFGGSGFGGSGFGGSGFGNSHTMLPRANVARGHLTPAHTDYEALSEAATVLAFVLCLTASGHLVYEVLNVPDHATYVFRASGGVDGVAASNRALDLLGFRVEGIYQDASSAGSRYRKAAERLPALRLLRESFAGRVIHTDGWVDQLRSRLSPVA
jgi:hypothetical protein